MDDSLADPTPDLIHCATHGRSARVIACRHVVRGGRLRLFFVPADDEWPLQGWCGTCERARIKDKGWHDHADATAQWKLICMGCFDKTSRRALSATEIPAIPMPEEDEAQGPGA